VAAAQDQGTSSQDPAKAAKLLSDIASVDQEADLAGLTVIEADNEFIKIAAAQVSSIPAPILIAHLCLAC
jgi:hypothetical protein